MNTTEMCVAFKQQGNEFYKSYKYVEALTWYTQALHCGNVSEEVQANLHNNKAACFLKLEEFQDVVKETDLCKLRNSHYSL